LLVVAWDLLVGWAKQPSFCIYNNIIWDLSGHGNLPVNGWYCYLLFGSKLLATNNNCHIRAFFSFASW
jgi:hypothetical protein